MVGMPMPVAWQNILVHLRSLLYGCLLLFLFLNQFPHVTALSEISFYLACGISLILAVKGELSLRWKTPLLIPLVILILWATASSLWAADPMNTLHNVYKHLIKFLTLYILLVSVFARPEDLPRLAGLILLSVACLSLAAMIQDYILLGNSPLMHRLTPPAARISTNRTGRFCMIAILCGMTLCTDEKHSWWRIALIVGILIATAAMLLIPGCSDRYRMRAPRPRLAPSQGNGCHARTTRHPIFRPVFLFSPLAVTVYTHAGF